MNEKDAPALAWTAGKRCMTFTGLSCAALNAPQDITRSCLPVGERRTGSSDAGRKAQKSAFRTPNSVISISGQTAGQLISSVSPTASTCCRKCRQAKGPPAKLPPTGPGNDGFCTTHHHKNNTIYIKVQGGFCENDSFYCFAAEPRIRLPWLATE